MLQEVPAVMRHGDLWTGNLLVSRGRLCGVIDWDASDPAAVPGSDLLQLVAGEIRRRARASLGTAFLMQPWRTDLFTKVAAPYWSEIELEPTPQLLDLVGIAWWATEAHGTLARLPHRAADRGWVESNVEAVLSALAP